jgi:ankyrin repeat protein
MNPLGRTPLHLAAQEGKVEVVKFSLDWWSSAFTVKDHTMQTALHHAASEAAFSGGTTEVIVLLVEY